MNVEEAWAQLREAETALWVSERRVRLADRELNLATNERKNSASNLTIARGNLHSALNSELEAL